MNDKETVDRPRKMTPAVGVPWWKILTVWTRQEVTLLLREPVAVFFSMMFPVIMYVFIGIPYGDKDIGDGIKFIDAMFSALIVSVIANLLLMGLPIYLAELRSKGVDKRYAILPLPGGVFIWAVLLATLTLVLAAAIIIITVVAVRDGIRPQLWELQYLALVLGCVIWLSAMGFFIGALRISSRTTQALSAVLFFTMFFGSGAAVPLEGLPEVLQQILEWNPLKQWLDVMVDVYVGKQPSETKYLRLLMAIPLTLICVLAGLHSWKRRR